MAAMTQDEIRTVVVDDFWQTGPDTPSGRYLRQFWQPMCRAIDLPVGRAKPIRMYNEEFTIYRGTSGTPYLLGFRCAHRGTQLSTGWVEGECIRCFFHGWMYDGSGQCVQQPPERPAFADRIRIPSYPVQEYLGLIFAYLGEGTPPSLPRFPEWEPGFRTTAAIRHVNYLQSLENDSTHIHFVHRTRWGPGPGLWEKPENLVQPLRPRETEWGGSAGGRARMAR
jgi:5,5'-dehydrodivanillate O-demethylase oxygenase subunit